MKLLVEMEIQQVDLLEIQQSVQAIDIVICWGKIEAAITISVISLYLPVSKEDQLRLKRT